METKNEVANSRQDVKKEHMQHERVDGEATEVKVIDTKGTEARVDAAVARSFPELDPSNGDGASVSKDSKQKLEHDQDQDHEQHNRSDDPIHNKEIAKFPQLAHDNKHEENRDNDHEPVQKDGPERALEEKGEGKMQKVKSEEIQALDVEDLGNVSSKCQI
jgi:hypothetical protein